MLGVKVWLLLHLTCVCVLLFMMLITQPVVSCTSDNISRDYGFSPSLLLILRKYKKALLEDKPLRVFSLL